MKNRINKLFSRPFVRNVALMTIGTGVSQFISLAFAPLITRLYGPESIGLQGIFLSFLGILSTFSALSYPNSIVLPKLNKDALELVILSIYISLSTSIIIGICVFFFGDDILNMLNSQEMSPYLFLLPIAIFISVLYTILGECYSRMREFRIGALSSIILVVVSILIKISLGYTKPSALSLIIANIVGIFISTICTLLIWRRFRKIKYKELFSVSLIPIALKYKDFPIYRTPQNLINAISQSLPIFLLASFFSVSIAGQYSIAITLLGVPSAFIGGAVMSVFYPRVTEALRNGEDAKSLIIKATKSLMKISIIPFIIVAIFGPRLFEFVFGEQWIMAGKFSQWLSIWLFFQLINKPAVSAIAALRLQGGLLIYEIVSTSTKILALWLGYMVFKDSLVAVALFSIFGGLAYLWLIFWVIKHSGKKECLNICK